MSNISQWSASAASNNAAPPDGFPEGQAPSTVNDCARELMAAVARQYLDSDGSLVTTGAANAYALTTNSGHIALGDQGLILFRADRANTGAATLEVDSLGAKNLQANGADLVAGDLQADTLYAVAYNATADTYDLLNSKLAVNDAVSTLFFNITIKRIEALANGEFALFSDGDTDTEIRRFLLKHADGTDRGYVGYVNNDVLQLYNAIHGGNVQLTGENNAGAGRNLYRADPDGGVEIPYPGNDATHIETIDETAADNSSGANVRGADGTLRGIGYNLLPRITVSGGNRTVAQADQGKSFYYDEATARSIVFNNDGNIPVDAYGHIRVGPTAGVLTLDAGVGVTFTYYDGNAYQTTTAPGDLELGDGSYTWWKQSDTNFFIDGPNITAV